jgi:hypothetical protein
VLAALRFTFLALAASLLGLAAALPAAADDGALYSRGQIAEAMRRAGFHESDIPVGVAIVTAESGGRAGATNDGSATRTREFSVGPWQINLHAHGSRISETGARDLQSATDYAFQLWRASGWNPWGAYTNGSYLRYLDGAPPPSSGVDLLRKSGAAERPAATRLLASDLPAAAVRPQLVVLVGGLGSAHDASEFDVLLEPFRNDPRYAIVRFGGSPEHPYDTTGSLEANGQSLAAFVRAHSPRYDGVHLVTHSMGGAVVDRAFALGLSSADGVRTYTALAAPHDGATAAMLARRTLDLAGEDAPLVRSVYRAVGLHDLGSAAVMDLAATRAAPGPAGVARLEVRMATDQVVLAPDSRGTGADSRVLLPDSLRDLEGHGGILVDPRARELVRATIESGTPHADERAGALRAAASITDHLVSGAAFAGILVLGTLTWFAVERLRYARRRYLLPA